MFKLPFTILFTFFVIRASAQEINLTQIEWPLKYQPSISKFYVHNSIEINASPDIVWGLLIDANAWNSWYEGAVDVVFLNKADTVITSNSIFNWKTMSLHFQSEIKEFIPGKVLAWESKRKSIQGYHVWLIIPTDNGCKVITDESQNGWLTFFEKTFQGKKLKKLHDVWLKGLKEQAESK